MDHDDVARTTSMIMLLILAVLFTLVYASDLMRNAILTRPAISKYEAIAIAENYSKVHVRGFTELTLYNATGGYRIHSPYTNAPWYATFLIYLHPNGTRYLISPTNDKTFHSCSQAYCFDNAIRIGNSTQKLGRLIYLVDAIANSNYTVAAHFPFGPLPCSMGGYFEIDANTGELLAAPVYNMSNRQICFIDNTR